MYATGEYALGRYRYTMNLSQETYLNLKLTYERWGGAGYKIFVPSIFRKELFAYYVSKAYKRRILDLKLSKGVSY